MSEIVRSAALIAATIATGLIAGLYYGWACSVMPGVARTDDRTMIGALQGMNVAIINPWFMASFGGSLLLTLVAALLHLNGEWRRVLPWIVTAFVLYAATLISTARVNVPLNNQLMAAGAPDRIADLAAVREQFEARWVRWHLARTIAATLAFGSLTWALVLHGRIT
jgi:uncharacterized membrane protein